MSNPSIPDCAAEFMAIYKQTQIAFGDLRNLTKEWHDLAVMPEQIEASVQRSLKDAIILMDRLRYSAICMVEAAKNKESPNG